MRTPLNTLYREFGVLKLKDLHHLNIRCIVHKSIHFPHLLPVAINEIFCLNEQIHDYNTRNKMDPHPIKIKTKLYGEKAFSFQGRNCWNNLPSNIKEINSRNFDCMKHLRLTSHGPGLSWTGYTTHTEKSTRHRDQIPPIKCPVGKLLVYKS